MIFISDGKLLNVYVFIYMYCEELAKIFAMTYGNLHIQKYNCKLFM